jgi:two-component system, NarL family, invasion response regulator UvrY
MKTNRLLIADDHSIVRTGLKTVMKSICPFASFDEAVNGDEVIQLAKVNAYDMMVLDINMPGTDAITLISNLFVYRENPKILIFSMNSELLYARRFLKLGVLGYLDKESAADEIKNAIELVLNGQQYMSPTLKKYFHEDSMAKRVDNPFEKLSNREIQIAKYLLLGYSLAEIRKVLNLHSSTVGTHKIRFFEKLKIKNLFELRELIKLYQIDLTKI